MIFFLVERMGVPVHENIWNERVFHVDKLFVVWNEELLITRMAQIMNI